MCRFATSGNTATVFPEDHKLYFLENWENLKSGVIVLPKYAVRTAKTATL